MKEMKSVFRKLTSSNSNNTQALQTPKEDNLCTPNPSSPGTATTNFPNKRRLLTAGRKYNSMSIRNAFENTSIASSELTARSSPTVIRKKEGSNKQSSTRHSFVDSFRDQINSQRQSSRKQYHNGTNNFVNDTYVGQ